MSTDFARRPRSLDELEFWKATEFRTVLLYSGCIALKEVLQPEYYHNFLTLCVAIRLLLVPTNTNIYNAERLLDTFVEEFGKLYGSHTLVYNIHSLTHLASNVREHGSLEEFSAFPYENFLYKVNKLVRGSRHVIQQVIRRISECNALETFVEEHHGLTYPQLSQAHTTGPVPADYIDYEQHRVAKLENFTVNTTRDKCVHIGSNIAIIRNILHLNGDVSVVYQVFAKVGNLFTHPTKSTNVGIYKVSGLKTRLMVTSINSVTKKCTLMYYKKTSVARTRKYVAITILHTA